MKNKFLEKLDTDLLKKLPLNYKFVQSQNNARNETKPNVDNENIKSVEIDFYEIKKFHPYGFYKPISKIIDISKNVSDE